MHRSVRFPDELDARIVALARAEDRSFSRVVVRALEQALSGAPLVGAPVVKESQGSATASRLASDPTSARASEERAEIGLRMAEGPPPIAKRHWAS